MKSLYSVFCGAQLTRGMMESMRNSFEQKISKYNEAIKESIKDTSKEGREAALLNKKYLTEDAAHRGFTNIEAEERIFQTQKQKLERVKKFKKFLEKTRGENGRFIHPEIDPKLPLVKLSENGMFQVVGKDGAKTITRGELFTDHEWEIEYSFDPSVSIHDVRKYYLDYLKLDLREKLDQQIITSETAFTRGDSFKQSAYKEIGKRMEQGSEQHGVIAEKMVRNFLKKLAIDTRADFEIVEANAYQDVEQKVDFIIHRKSADKTRGAQVVESDRVQDIGIQFTTNVSAVEHKQHQVEKAKKRAGDFQDIVVVTLPTADASMLYKKWGHKKESGGPEKLWDKKTQETIFRGVMAKVLSEEEIDRFCQEYF